MYNISLFLQYVFNCTFYLSIPFPRLLKEYANIFNLQQISKLKTLLWEKENF